MRKLRKAKAVLKLYGPELGPVYMQLLYSFLIQKEQLLKKNDGMQMEDFQRAFIEYISIQYGKDFCADFWAFCEENLDNKKLIKFMKKHEAEYLLQDLSAKVLKRKEGSLAYEYLEKQDPIKGAVTEIKKAPYSVSAHLAEHLPVRNLDYISPSPIRKSYRFTMKRLVDDSVYIEYHSGKDLNEALSIVNRISFDSAKIIMVEEEKTGKRVL